MSKFSTSILICFSLRAIWCHNSTQQKSEPLDQTCLCKVSHDFTKTLFYQQMLFIRHQFKVAFFQELKQDTHMALKHYKQAYGYCLEAKVNEHTILEVKTVAGFVSYKVYSLHIHSSVQAGLAFLTSIVMYLFNDKRLLVFILFHRLSKISFPDFIRIYTL